MYVVVKVFCILRNMIAHDRGYEGIMKLRKEMEKDNEINLRLKRVMHVKCIREGCRRQREEYVDGDDMNAHGEFTKSLIEHIWSRAVED